MKAGEILQKHRKSQGLTQAELAEKLGVSQSTIGKIESGDRRLSLTMMGDIQDIFLDDFLIEIMGFDSDKYDSDLQDKVISKLCDLYETGVYLDEGNFCFIHYDNRRYLIEQNKIDELYKRFFEHMQIEFNALLKTIENVVPEDFEKYINGDE